MLNKQTTCYTMELTAHDKILWEDFELNLNSDIKTKGKLEKNKSKKYRNILILIFLTANFMNMHMVYETPNTLVFVLIFRISH